MREQGERHRKMGASKIQNEVAMLRSLPMFANMPAPKLKLLAFASDRVTFRAGEVLFRQGDDGDAAYIIIEGRAEILVSAGEHDVKVAEVGENAFVGDMGVISDMPRTATVRALDDLVTLRIRKDHMMEMVRESQELALAVLREVVGRLARTTRDLSAARAEIEELKG